MALLEPIFTRIAAHVAQSRPELFDRLGLHAGKRFIINPAVAVLKRIFSDDIIFTAAPFALDCKWWTLWGDKNSYQLKEFSTFDEAESEYLAIKSSKSLGVGYTSIKVCDIGVQRAKCIVNLESYLNIIENILRS